MQGTMSEESEQITVVAWCELMSVPVVHVPNEGKRSVQRGAAMKRMGLRSGFPDLFIPLARGKYHGLFVEMKVKPNKPTAKQIEWLTRLSEEGYACSVCYGADEAISTIKSYLNLGGK